MRTKKETIDAGNRRYEIWEEAHPAGTIYQVPYRCYHGEGLHTLGKIVTLKPAQPTSVVPPHGVTIYGFSSQAAAGDAVMKHSKRKHRRGGVYGRR